jgi:mannose-6-phosphate isomerase-like protein (cupin superfamily)
MEKINIAGKFALFSEYWSPKIIGELNGQQIRIAKAKGEFVWHHHADAEEMFMVMKGSLTIQFREKEVRLHEGEICIVPRGVEHRPVADEEVHLLLFEPASTLNTGNLTEDEKTVRQPERL